jgi:hypothetical protein
MLYKNINLFVSPTELDFSPETESVEFEINGDYLAIRRYRTDEFEKYPAIEGFDVYFLIDDAKKIRDFLVFALSGM